MSEASAWPEAGEIEIEPETVAGLRAVGVEFRLIDCREPDEWETTRIEGAELLPLSGFGENFTKVLPDAGEPIVIHCHHGMRSERATQFLRQKGYRRVWSMARGIEGWSLEVDAGVARY